MSARRFMWVSTATRIIADVWRQKTSAPITPDISAFMKCAAHELFIQFGPEPDPEDEKLAKVEIVGVLQKNLEERSNV